MVGASPQDAPALAAADVGIAVGDGIDIVQKAAGVTLVDGDLQGVVRALQLSEAALRNVGQNLLLAVGYNALGIALAAGALYPLAGRPLSPLLASIAMSISSACIIGNAMRLRSVRA
jgi:Cu+-exporting ATPase